VPPSAPSVASLGLAVRQLREECGLSQERLGQLTGLHRNYVGGVERGERNPSFTSLLSLAGGLGVRPSELVARAETLAG
jgi:transcriptional regulator with XRE-family HTH domain